MATRQDCAHYQSRTYDDDGEVARFCTLGLGPEAPWKCPDKCGSYERILMIAGDFDAGSLGGVATLEPEPEGRSDDIIDVLADAEQIVHDAEPSVIADLDRAGHKPSGWWRRRRPGRRNDDGLSNR